MKFSSNEIIGLRISRFRKEKNLTQQQLSEKINVSVNEISNLERGKNNLSYNTLLN
ncbi:MAG: helix-turn-helix domain-containing protein, partial [Eubacterium sp.]|nr:helix-turn-helix domain-containing protein [Eubacterium sp.]